MGFPSASLRTPGVADNCKVCPPRTTVRDIGVFGYLTISSTHSRHNAMLRSLTPVTQSPGFRPATLAGESATTSPTTLSSTGCNPNAPNIGLSLFLEPCCDRQL